MVGISWTTGYRSVLCVAYAKITRIWLPPHLYDDQMYDKWGNPILANGTRLRGELFHDASVQRVLAPYLHLFTNLVKYPRTYHLPWSLGMHDDDRQHTSIEQFTNQHVVCTLKMDGENTTLYRDHIHARSLDSQNHPSRNWVKQYWSTIRHEIPPDWRICGENLYAKHSIGYTDLESYFLGFSVWNARNECLSWSESVEWFQLLGITPVTVLWEGMFHEYAVRTLARSLDYASARKGTL